MLTLNTNQVIIRPGLERFRKELGDIEELALSIKQHGQLQPILINKDYELIAGGRRLAACKLYNMPISATIIDENDSLTMRQLEIEENIQRKDFTPAEHVLAIKELHELRQKLHKSEATNRISGSTWTMEDTAQLINKDRTSVSKDLDIAEMVTAFPELSKCKTKSELRAASKALEKLINRADAIGDYTAILQNLDKVQAKHTSAEEFLPTIESNSVNILLCDPPYGIEINKINKGIGNKVGNGANNYQGFTYSDLQEESIILLQYIAKESFRICKDTAHAYIFCAPEFFCSAYYIFFKAGWEPCIRPLIWIKPGQGQSNLPEKWPVASYEMCLYARRKNSKLLYARPDNIICNRIAKETKIHPTQKPVSLLRDLITRSVHPGATLLDPCMGSGSSLVAGIKEKLIVKGCEISKASYTAAVEYISQTLETE